MSLEFEKRFKNFKYKDLKIKFNKLNISSNGGDLYVISSFEKLKLNQSIRTRKEGSSIKFNIKDKNIDSFDKEWEIDISNQDIMDEMLEQLGIKKKYKMEKFREKYIDNLENEYIFDHYPGAPPYLEIESKTEKNLNIAIKNLGLKQESYFTIKDIYFNLYGITKNRPEGDLTFNTADKELSSYITKDKDNFNKILNHQKDFLNKYENKHNSQMINTPKIFNSE
jgi:adenylate cyclase class IV